MPVYPGAFTYPLFHSDDTDFPMVIVGRLRVTLRPDIGHKLRWREQIHELRFDDVEFQMTDDVTTYR